jgi:hypothetical protein
MAWLKGKSLLPMWLAFIGASIVGADQASACSCVASTATSIIERADVAFEGEVVDVGVEPSCVDFVREGRRHPLSCDQRARLRVLMPLKGQPGGIVTVYTPVLSTACGYGFRKGERLKVVAWYQRDRRLSTGSCAMMSANPR